MKKIMSVTFALVLLGSIEANALWWRKEIIKCTSISELKISLGPFEAKIGESYETTKTICKAGVNWCFTGFCM